MNFSFLIVTLPFNIDIFLFMTKRSTHSWYKFFSCILKSLWLIYANKQFGKCPSVLSNFLHYGWSKSLVEISQNVTSQFTTTCDL
jgi:hypothetical protein